jgi:trk system potassium uptake protein TrkA
MRVIIVGCGRLGAELAYRLYRRGHDVSVIDNVEAAFNSLPADFQGHLCEGEALNQDVLHRAGIQRADALAAVTSSDALNMVIGHIARQVYDVPVVIARNYGPNCLPLFEVFDLQTVSSTSWGAQRVEEMLSHSDLRTVFSAGNGEVEIYEIQIPDSIQESSLHDLLPAEVIPVSVTRAGRAILPDANIKVRAEDILHVSATFEGIQKLREIMSKSQKEA